LVDRDRGHRHRDPGLHRGLPGGDLALPGLEHVAHDHVVDLLRPDAAPLERGLDRVAAEVHRGERRQSARELADGRPGGGDDDRTGHGGPRGAGYRLVTWDGSRLPQHCVQGVRAPRGRPYAPPMTTAIDAIRTAILEGAPADELAALTLPEESRGALVRAED